MVTSRHMRLKARYEKIVEQLDQLNEEATNIESELMFGKDE